MLKSYINYRTKNNSLFKCKPDFDIVLALFTLCLMWISYYGVMNISWYKGSDIVSILLFVILTNICLAVAFPIWWIKNHKKQPLSELGLTKKYLILSIAISLILAFWRGIDLIPAMQNLDLSIWLPVMISSALIFWEPFFVFGGTSSFTSDTRDAYVAKFTSEGIISNCTSPMCQNPDTLTSSPNDVITIFSATTSSPLSPNISSPVASESSPNATSAYIVLP